MDVLKTILEKQVVNAQREINKSLTIMQQEKSKSDFKYNGIVESEKEKKEYNEGMLVMAQLVLDYINLQESIAE